MEPFGHPRHCIWHQTPFSRAVDKITGGIPSNILSDKLDRLVKCGVLSKSPDPTHKQRVIYSLTEMGISLVPVLAQLSVRGRHFLPVSDKPGARAKVLEDGGPEFWSDFMDELREVHLREQKPPAEGSVRQHLQKAYEEAVVHSDKR